ncbi:A24 family peptidase [Arthrobacter sp. CG_A4]|uniref:A24 family peptidase n=1 Tax=Arthrobacter sp. CG_A4 TaxID=3071706 RepID=UPI002DFD5E1C|nr:leader peptidase (prepilin peptidase)/N-methyltransferase [Arthrobacter sp. CG_A4]
MSLSGIAASAGPLLVISAGLFGLFAGMLSELVIARSLPRLGVLPARRTRITTAALTGLLCAALALRFGTDWSLPAFLVLGVLAVQLARIDLSFRLLPNPLVGAMLVSGLALFAVNSAATTDWFGFLRAVAGATVLFVVFLILALVSPHGIGMGDVKLAAPVGLYLGFLGWSQVFYGGALGFVVGGIVSLVAMRRQIPGRAAEVAFGPSLLAAALGLVLFTS